MLVPTLPSFLLVYIQYLPLPRLIRYLFKSYYNSSKELNFNRIDQLEMLVAAHDKKLDLHSKGVFLFSLFP